MTCVSFAAEMIRGSERHGVAPMDSVRTRSRFIEAEQFDPILERSDRRFGNEIDHARRGFQDIEIIPKFRASEQRLRDREHNERLAVAAEPADQRGAVVLQEVLYIA